MNIKANFLREKTTKWMDKTEEKHGLSSGNCKFVFLPEKHPIVYPHYLTKSYFITLRKE